MNKLARTLHFEYDVEAAGSEAAPLTSEQASRRRHFLFVSAPFGPFGRELSAALEAMGARGTRVILNGGDYLDWVISRRGMRDSVTFRGGMVEWPAWLDRQIDLIGVTDIVTYGDSNPYCVSALAHARALGLRTHVLEQGYFRPDWVTVESDGVNANSSLSADPQWYLRQAEAAPETPAHSVGRITPSAVGYIIRYHVALYLAAVFYPRYRTHYRDTALRQAGGHIWRYLLQFLQARNQELICQEAFTSEGPIFLALLQRPGDSQLWRHSDLGTVEAFVERVLPSFAAHAPKDARLVFKSHPLDPGLEKHAEVIARRARALGVADRVRYVDCGKLHEILPLIRGSICVNSTAGLAAIEFGRPSMVLGRAIYDMPGMTHQSGLNRFWRQPEAPCPKLYAAFRRVVLARTQVNGAYSTRRGRAMAVGEIARRLLLSPPRCHSAASIFEPAVQARPALSPLSVGPAFAARVENS